MTTESADQAAPTPVLTEKHVRYMATVNSAEHGFERARITAYATDKVAESVEFSDGSYTTRRFSPAEARAIAKALAAAADAAQLA